MTTHQIEEFNDAYYLPRNECLGVFKLRSSCLSHFMQIYCSIGPHDSFYHTYRHIIARLWAFLHLRWGTYAKSLKQIKYLVESAHSPIILPETDVQKVIIIISLIVAVRANAVAPSLKMNYPDGQLWAESQYTLRLMKEAVSAPDVFVTFLKGTEDFCRRIGVWRTSWRKLPEIMSINGNDGHEECSKMFSYVPKENQ